MDDFNTCIGSAIPGFACLFLLFAIPVVGSNNSQRLIRLYLLACPCPLIVWFIVWIADSWGFRGMWGNAPVFGLGVLAWFLLWFIPATNKWSERRKLHRTAILLLVAGPLVLIEFVLWAFSGEYYLGIANDIEKADKITDTPVEHQRSVKDLK